MNRMAKNDNGTAQSGLEMRGEGTEKKSGAKRRHCLGMHRGGKAKNCLEQHCDGEAWKYKAIKGEEKQGRSIDWQDGAAARRRKTMQ